MAKGGYQRRRIEAKKAAERAARKRARQRKQIMTWLVGLVLLGMLAAVVLVAFTGDDDPNFAADGSPTPTPSTPAPDCPAGPKEAIDKAPKMTIDKAKTYTATMKTSKGTIEVRLLDDDAPVTVNNFVFLAREKFYDNTPFHRVIAGFGGPGSDMVQGGDGTNCNGTGDPGYEFKDENMVAMDEPGLLAMANGGPGTNGSQFFLLNGTVSHLNQEGACPGQGCHSVFGKVTDGIDVIGAIAASPLNGERPDPAIVLESVTIKES